MEERERENLLVRWTSGTCGVFRDDLRLSPRTRTVARRGEPRHREERGNLAISTTPDSQSPSPSAPKSHSESDHGWELGRVGEAGTQRNGQGESGLSPGEDRREAGRRPWRGERAGAVPVPGRNRRRVVRARERTTTSEEARHRHDRRRSPAPGVHGIYEQTLIFWPVQGKSKHSFFRCHLLFLINL